MAAPQAPPEPLSPEYAGRLAEFAKACRAATRIVSMYPATHPAIQSALARIGEATKQATIHGPFSITVLPDALLVNGRGLPKPESSATELAVLLHQQLISEVTLFDRLDNDGWHAFLTLLAKSPEDARAIGGVAKAWEETGNKSITLTEIDYAEVLRERSGTGDSATWDRILTALKDEKDDKDQPGAAMQNMMELADTPERLAHFAQHLQDVSKASGDDSIQQRKALREMMHGLANYAAERAPEKLDEVLNKMAGAAAQMSPDMLLTLITDPPPLPGGAGPRMDLAGELQARLTDEMLTKFLVDNVFKDRGATNRLATAFQTLVPDPAKQQDILSAAAEQASTLFKDDPQFESVWTSSTKMLMTYSDEKFVSEGYARELTTAKTQAVDVERIGDDPPARIRAWLSTVSDGEMRALEQQLILDLLQIETRADAWAGVLDTAIASIDQLVLVGDLLAGIEAARSGRDDRQGQQLAVHGFRGGRRHEAGRRPDGPAFVAVPAESDRLRIRGRQEDVHQHRPVPGQADVGRADGRGQYADRAPPARHPGVVRPGGARIRQRVEELAQSSGPSCRDRSAARPRR